MGTTKAGGSAPDDPVQTLKDSPLSATRRARYSPEDDLVTCLIPPTEAASGGAGVPSVLPVENPHPDRFDDLGEIGRGGMGRVDLVFDKALQRTMARKRLLERVAEDVEVRSRFTEEAQITAQLEHPSIVPVHDVRYDSQRGLTFAMKLIRGETFGELLATLHGGPLSRPALVRIVNVVLKVCDAIAFAHTRGVIHRDLKPSNVMVGSHGQVYVMDWGVALLRSNTRQSRAPISVTSGKGLDTAGTMAGTTSYMPPEQALGLVDSTDERSDVYGIGGLLYHALTGAAPHAAPTDEESLRMAERGEVRPPNELSIWPDLPPGLVEIAMRALHRHPSDRYQRVGELATDLEDFLHGGGWFATQRFAPGETIVSEGEAADHAYIIVDGHCDVFKQLDGERRHIRRMGPEGVFGETAILTGKPRTATVVAVDDVVTKVVTRDALENELSASPWLKLFVEALAERFLEVEGKLSGK